MRRIEYISASNLTTRLEVLAAEGWEPLSLATYSLEPTSQALSLSAGDQAMGNLNQFSQIACGYDAQMMAQYLGPHYVVTAFMVILEKVGK